MQAIPLGYLSARYTLLIYPWQRYHAFSGSSWKMNGGAVINWGNPVGTGGIPQSPLPALVPSSSYGAEVSNSRGHQSPVSAVTACFGGIRHVWAKVVQLLWEVVLCCKQEELRIAAVRLTVVSGKRLHAINYLQWAMESTWDQDPGACSALASQEWVLHE